MPSAPFRMEQCLYWEAGSCLFLRFSKRITLAGIPNKDTAPFAISRRQWEKQLGWWQGFAREIGGTFSSVRLVAVFNQLFGVLQAGFGNFLAGNQPGNFLDAIVFGQLFHFHTHL